MDSWTTGGETWRREDIQALPLLLLSMRWWELLQFSSQCTPWKTNPGHAWSRTGRQPKVQNKLRPFPILRKPVRTGRASQFNLMLMLPSYGGTGKIFRNTADEEIHAVVTELEATGRMQGVWEGYFLISNLPPPQCSFRLWYTLTIHGIVTDFYKRSARGKWMSNVCFNHAGLNPLCWIETLMSHCKLH